MKNEDELQRSVEQGDVASDMDSKAYEIVFQALKKEPETKLSPNFSDRIVEIAARRSSGSASKEFIWLGLGVFLLIVAMIVVMTKITMPKDFGFLSSMSSYAGLFVFGLIFIAFLNYLDRRFIHQNRVV